MNLEDILLDGIKYYPGVSREELMVRAVQLLDDGHPDEDKDIYCLLDSMVFSGKIESVSYELHNSVLADSVRYFPAHTKFTIG